MPIGTPPTVPVTLRDGALLRVRPLLRADRDRLAIGFEDLSEAARYQRFLTPVSHLSTSQLKYLTDIDHVGHFAWGAETESGIGIAIARYVRIDSDVAEAAFTITDDFQGRGLGWMLLQALAMVGAFHGFQRFEMTMLADNTAMSHLALKAGARFDPPAGGTVRAEFDLDPTIWAELPTQDTLLKQASEAARAA